MRLNVLILLPFLGVISPNSFVDREFSPVYNLIVRAGSDFCGVNATNGEIGE